MEQRTVKGLYFKVPRAAPSVWGMPLPRIMGTSRTSTPMTSAIAANAANSRGIRNQCPRR